MSKFYNGLEEMDVDPNYVCNTYKSILVDGNYKDFIEDYEHISKCVCGKDLKTNYYIINNKHEKKSILVVGKGCLTKYILREMKEVNMGDLEDKDKYEIDREYRPIKEPSRCAKCTAEVNTYIGCDSASKEVYSYYCKDCNKSICRNCEESEKYKNHPYCVKCIKQLYGICKNCNIYHNSKASNFCIKCSNKPRCCICEIVMKNDKYKKCYSCLLKNEKKCRICGKTHYGNFPNCYTCWTESKYKYEHDTDEDIEVI